MDRPPDITIEELVDRYDALLLDAYGVLVHSTGAFDGAEDCIAYLRDREIPFWVVTNDASRLPESAAEKYRRSGLPIETEQVITSGALIAPYFAEHDLGDAATAVLGTDDSAAYVDRAGGRVVSARDEAFDVLVLGDDAGFPFRETMDACVSHLIRRFDAGDPVRMVLPNPDLVYQQAADRFGFATGSIARMFEAVLAERFPSQQPTFDRLGKPHTPIYEEARRRAGTDHLAMIGDQLATDIAGANRAGIDSVLVPGGVTNIETALDDAEQRPDFLLESLAPSGD